MSAGVVVEAAAGGAEDLRAVARLLAPGALRTTVPPLPAGTVRRRAALDRLAAHPDAACVLVNAPAGYGKTTILATLADQDPRPCAWVTLGRADDDPTALLAHLLLALDGVDAVPDAAFEHLLLSDADLETARLPRLVELLVSRPRPFLLALDDAHRLEGDRSRDVVRTLVEHVPAGSCVAIATRDASRLALARARAARSVLDVEVPDLTMSPDEGARLLRGAGLDASDDDAAVLVQQTEGWPAALYLCAVALRDASPDAIAKFRGSDRVVADYLVTEVLATVDPALVAFMRRTAILDRLSGALCDAVLEQSGSATTLEQLASENRLVVPLDRSGEWYRYHHLFQDLLLAELVRREPEVVAGLHARACTWFDAAGDADEAIRHAHASGDRDRVTEIMWRNAVYFITTGREGSVDRWLEPFRPDEVAASPALAAIAAWCGFARGDTHEVAGWLACITERGTERLPSGAPVDTAASLLRALEGSDSSQMRLDAELAFLGDLPESPYRPVAALLEGAAARLLGDVVGARASLERAAALGAHFAPSTRMHALAFLALLAADDGEWAEAESLARRSLQIAEENHFGVRPQGCVPYAVGALVAAHAGSTAEARDHAKRAESLLLGLRGFGPWIAVEVRLQLARVSLFLGETDEARRSLTIAAGILAQHPNLGSLPERVAAVRRVADNAAIPLGLQATPLTAAELRVLRYLPTHLSFAEIAGELFVSRNTVKTQAISIYRKLDVSSRGAAVERARELGLVDA